MTTPIQFTRATRQAVKVKAAVEGPSGSGKTEGMLALLTGITNGGKIAVADTENASASYYSDRYAFDTVAVPNADAKVLMEVIRAAVAAGYDALGIDSMSHAWKAILDAKDKYDLANPTANKWASWGRDEFGPQWEKLMKLILDAPIHIVATMRSKQAHEQIEDGGKKKVVKLGLKPEVREGAEYEFGLVFSVNMAHMAEASKDRTHLFPAGTMIDLTDVKVHKALIGWMTSETPATHDDCVTLSELAQDPRVSDVARKAVEQLLASATPGAGKVAKWTAQLREKIATTAVAPVASEAAPSELFPEPSTRTESRTPTNGPSKQSNGAAAITAADADPRAALKAAIDHPFMPKPAREYFSKRIADGKVQSETAVKVALAMANICLEIGDELTATTAKHKSEVESLLRVVSTFTPETLTGIRDTLREQHPVGAAG